MKLLRTVGLICLLAGTGIGQSWRKVTTTEEDVFYYQPSSVNQDAKTGVFRVWVMSVPVDLAKERKQWNDIDPGKFDNYAYSLALWDIRCGSRQSSLMESDQYTAGGTLLSSDVFKHQWDNIVPDSALDGVLKLICPRKSH